MTQTTINTDITPIVINYDHSASFHNTLNRHLVNRWEHIISSNNSFLHLPRWYAAYLDSYYTKKDKNVQALFFELRNSDKSIAIIPLLIKREKTGPLSINELELMWPTDLGVRDCIALEDINFDMLFQTVIHSLSTIKIKWDIFRLPDIVFQNNAYRLVTRQKSHPYNIRHHHYSASVPVYGNGEGCLQFLSRRMRKRLDTYEKNLSQKGSLRFEFAQGIDITKKHFDSFLSVEASGWKGGNGTQTALKFDRYQERFYRHLFSNPSSSNLIASLFVNDEIVAGCLCLKAGDTLNLLKHGYNPTYSNEHPSDLLLKHLIQFYSTNLEINNISFVTAPAWTSKWHTDLTDVYNAVVYNDTLKGRLVKHIDAGLQIARRIKAGFNKKIKRPCDERL